MKHISIYLCSLLVFLLCACEKYLTIPPPKNELVSDLIFTSDKTATASVLGIYANMNSFNYQFNVLSSLLGGLSSDELEYRYTSEPFNQFKNNSLLYSNSYLSTLWSQAYSYIYSANACIEGLNAGTNISEATKHQLLGEVSFVRAFCYFYIVNMFGDVPLITTTDFQINNTLPRTPINNIYDLIISDLVNAQQLLVNDYPSEERIRPNRAAATALLARAYLYTNQWDQASDEASKVISNNTAYALESLNNAFLKNNKEAIWQLQVINPGWNTWEGSIFVGGLFRLRPELISAFGTGDLRQKNWIDSVANAKPRQNIPFKYKVRRDAVVTEYCMVLRLAEQYLIRAEALAQKGTTASLSEAVADLNIIRARAGLSPLPTTLAKDALLLAVEQERKVELFSEWGHRWFDLKRTGRATTVLSPIKPDWQPTDILYPIPESAMRTNKNLVQNP